METIKKCENCRFFGDEVMVTDPDSYDEVGSGFHTCTRIKQAEDFYTFENVKDDKACVQDGSEYFAALRVKGDFGCVAFEDKGNE